jgi:hypothetical protein
LPFYRHKNTERERLAQFRYRSVASSSEATMMSVRAINGCSIIRTATSAGGPPVSLFRHRIQRLRASHLREFSKLRLNFPLIRADRRFLGNSDAPSCSTCIHSLVESVSEELESISRRKGSRMRVRASVKYVAVSFSY